MTQLRPKQNTIFFTVFVYIKDNNIHATFLCAFYSGSKTGQTIMFGQAMCLSRL